MEQEIFYSFLRGVGVGALSVVVLAAFCAWFIWREIKNK